MSGSGTSFNQPYPTTSGGIMSIPHPSSIGGNIPLYENGIGAISTNYQPQLFLNHGGGKKTRRRNYKQNCKSCKYNGGNKKVKQKRPHKINKRLFVSSIFDIFTFV